MLEVLGPLQGSQPAFVLHGSLIAGEIVLAISMSTAPPHKGTRRAIPTNNA